MSDMEPGAYNEHQQVLRESYMVTPQKVKDRA